jgi:hypothetical protein
MVGPKSIHEHSTIWALLKRIIMSVILTVILAQSGLLSLKRTAPLRQFVCLPVTFVRQLKLHSLRILWRRATAPSETSYILFISALT